MTAQADHATQAHGDRMTVCAVERPSECLSDASNEGPFLADPGNPMLTDGCALPRWPTTSVAPDRSAAISSNGHSSNASICDSSSVCRYQEVLHEKNWTCCSPFIRLFANRAGRMLCRGRCEAGDTRHFVDRSIKNRSERVRRGGSSHRRGRMCRTLSARATRRRA
jgi:hypothetical protein